MHRGGRFCSFWLCATVANYNREIRLHNCKIDKTFRLYTWLITQSLTIKVQRTDKEFWQWCWGRSRRRTFEQMVEYTSRCLSRWLSRWWWWRWRRWRRRRRGRGRGRGRGSGSLYLMVGGEVDFPPRFRSTVATQPFPNGIELHSN